MTAYPTPPNNSMEPTRPAAAKRMRDTIEELAGLAHLTAANPCRNPCPASMLQYEFLIDRLDVLQRGGYQWKPSPSHPSSKSSSRSRFASGSNSGRDRRSKLLRTMSESSSFPYVPQENCAESFAAWTLATNVTRKTELECSRLV